MPVAVKLSPYFSSTGEMALRLDEAGADALVLFNRFLQPDIDPETLAVVPAGRALQPGRGPAAAHVDRAPARTGARLARRDHRRRDPADVAKYLLAGADVVMTASALLRHGPEHATVLLDGLSDWMARKGFAAVDELRGMLAVPPGTDEAAYERAGYVERTARGQQRHLRALVSRGRRRRSEPTRPGHKCAMHRPRSLANFVRTTTASESRRRSRGPARRPREPSVPIRPPPGTRLWVVGSHAHRALERSRARRSPAEAYPERAVRALHRRNDDVAHAHETDGALALDHGEVVDPV